MGALVSNEDHKQKIKEVNAMNKTSKTHVKRGNTESGPKILRVLSRFKLVNHKSVSAIKEGNGGVEGGIMLDSENLVVTAL